MIRDLTEAAVTLPTKLDQIVRLMRESDKSLRIEAMLDYSKRIPPLPDHIDGGALDQVKECQTPFFVATEVDADGAAHMYFDAPQESPTVRGFAGILLDGLDGEQAQVILDVPDDFYYDMGLDEVVTPLRLRGMGAILRRIKGQIRDQVA
jgi:cysteine desulfuration protein SufE